MEIAEKLINATDFYTILDISGEEVVCFRSVKDQYIKTLVFSDLTKVWDYEAAIIYRHRYPIYVLCQFYHGYVSNEGTSLKTDKKGKDLYKYIQSMGELLEKLFLARIDNGVLTLNDMIRYFPEEKEVVIQGEEAIGGIVRKSRIDYTWMGPVFRISLRVIHGLCGKIVENDYSFGINGFPGSVPISSLPIRLVTDSEKKSMSERGEKILSMSKPGRYLHYEGNMISPSWLGNKITRASGRVVIDPVSFSRLKPDVWGQCGRMLGINLEDDDEVEVTQKDETKLKEEDYWRCYPYLLGFSLQVKEWGRLRLSGLSEINFREDAFDRLVLDQDSKDLIYSLVKYHGGGFTDIIEGKGGGCIFLLHGEPGLGKTASAEAVAEILHKPLYSVSVGELGTDTEHLESHLRNILEVATIWDAVILLDEADIFLEARDEHDIERNAMVGVFLRLLEYHNGVLFLTTNRVKNIDKAFYSRISVALHFCNNGQEKREKIWYNLLEAAKMNAQWSKEMSVYNLNGRQIKNAIRLSQTLARADNGREIRIGDIKRSVEVAIKFSEDMKLSIDSYDAEPREKELEA